MNLEEWVKPLDAHIREALSFLYKPESRNQALKDLKLKGSKMISDFKSLDPTHQFSFAEKDFGKGNYFGNLNHKLDNKYSRGDGYYDWVEEFYEKGKLAPAIVINGQLSDGVGRALWFHWKGIPMKVYFYETPHEFDNLSLKKESLDEWGIPINEWKFDQSDVDSAVTYFSALDGDEDFEKAFKQELQKAKIKTITPEEASKLYRNHGNTFDSHPWSGRKGKSFDSSFKDPSIVISFEGKSYVIDGQHRMNQRIKEGLPVPVAIMNGEFLKKFDIDSNSFSRMKVHQVDQTTAESLDQWGMLITEGTKPPKFKSDQLWLLWSIISNKDRTEEFYLSPDGDEEWEFQQSENGETDREEWAKRESEFWLDQGYPSQLFTNPKLVPKGSWCIHFTDVNPLEIVEHGFKGRDPEIIGLTTHYKSDAHSGSIALAYSIDNVTHSRDGFGKYGKNAVIFQVGEAFQAYHHGDEEKQVMFDVKSAKNIWPVFEQSGMLVLYDKNGEKELYQCERRQECINQMLEVILKKRKSNIETQSLDQWGIPITEAKQEMEPPESIRAYIEGEQGLPDPKSKEVKKYHQWLQTVLPKEEYKIYRGFGYPGPIDESADDLFADYPLSFSEDKSTALAFAQEGVESDSSYYGYVVSVIVPKENIYFHWKYGGELGRSHPKEKEVLAMVRHFSYRIEKTIKPQEESVRESKKGFKGFDDPWKVMSPEDRKEANSLLIKALKAFPSSPVQQELSKKLNAILKKYGMLKNESFLDQWGIPLVEAKANFLKDYDAALRWVKKNVGDADIEDEETQDRITTYMDKYSEVMSNPTIEIYRGVMLPKVSDLDLKRVGTYWSFSKDGVGDYGSGDRTPKPNSKFFVLTGIANTKDIDWEYGFTSFIYYGEDQWECALNNKSSIQIIAVDDEKLTTPLKGKI